MQVCRETRRRSAVMPSPFPGMDPYLESSGLWQDLHHSLIYCAREALQPQLPLRYYALIEERIILEAPSRSYYPDVTIARQGAGTASAGGGQGAPGGGAVVVATMEADVAIEVEDEEEIRQGYLEIREVSGGRVVTVIEVISSANKVPGSRVHQTYLHKQADVLASDANLVEID